MILGEAILELLGKENDMEVTLVPKENAVELLKAVKENRPDAIIFANFLCPCELNSIQEITSFFPGITLVAFSASDNFIHIYQANQFILLPATDITQVVRSVPTLSLPGKGGRKTEPNMELTS